MDTDKLIEIVTSALSECLCDGCTDDDDTSCWKCRADASAIIARRLKELDAYRQAYPYGVDKYNGSDEPYDYDPCKYEIKALRKEYQELYCEVADTPQTDCKTCKHNGKYAYCRLCGMYGDDNYEPQTERNE